MLTNFVDELPGAAPPAAPASSSAPASASSARGSGATAGLVAAESFAPYPGKKPKRKKKHRKKGTEHKDLLAKQAAEVAAAGDGHSGGSGDDSQRAGKRRKRDGAAAAGFAGTTTGGTASRNILAGSAGGRHYTVSVAIPGSIVANAQSRELRTYLMGQVARSLAIFNIDEVVVFDDRSVAAEDVSGKRRPYGDPCHFMARVLQYLETPQVSHSLFCVKPPCIFKSPKGKKTKTKQAHGRTNRISQSPMLIFTHTRLFLLPTNPS